MDGRIGLVRLIRDNLVDVVGAMTLVLGWWMVVSLGFIVAWLALGGIVRWIARQDKEGLIIEVVGLLGIVAGVYWVWVISERGGL